MILAKKSTGFLREEVRKSSGKKATPTTAIVNRQFERPRVAKKEALMQEKITGRKQHLAVDTLGLILAISVQIVSVVVRISKDHFERLF